MTTEWHVMAEFDSQDQAKQAARMIEAMQPRRFVLTAIRDGRKVWQEESDGYQASELRI